MTFRKLFTVSVLVGIAETLQALAIIPFLGLLSSILDGREFNANLKYVFDKLETDTLLGVTLFTIFAVLILNFMRGILAYKRYMMLHMVRSLLSQKIVKNVILREHFSQRADTKDDLSVIFSTEIENYVVTYLQPKTILYQSISTLIIVISVILFVLPFYVMFAVVFLGVTYYLLTLIFKGINVDLGKQRFHLNEQRLIFADTFSSGNFEIELYGLRSSAAKKISSITSDLAIVTGRAHFFTQLPKYFVEAITFSGLALLIYTFYDNNQISESSTIYILGAASVALFKAIPALQAVYQNYTALKFAEPINKKIIEYLRPNYKKGTALEDLFFESIELSGVGLEQSGKKIFENLELKIERGEKVAITGVSGSGKTTLLNMLMGIEQNYSGEILLNNNDLREVSLDQYMQVFSFVPNKKIDLTSLVISELTQLQDSSRNNFSSGETQRNLIKLAENKLPQIYFLDEFTSSQDVKNQVKILNRITKEPDLTVISIVHRLETLHFYDKVYHLTRNGLTSEK